MLGGYIYGTAPALLTAMFLVLFQSLLPRNVVLSSMLAAALGGLTTVVYLVFVQEFRFPLSPGGTGCHRWRPVLEDLPKVHREAHSAMKPGPVY